MRYPLAHLEDSGPDLDEEDLKALEKQLKLKLPPSLRGLLLEVNGGDFEGHASFKIGNKSPGVRAFCRIEEDHCDDILHLCESVEYFDFHKHLPLASTWGGDFWVIGVKDHAIYYWDHEGGPLRKICDSLDEFLAGIEIEPAESEFEIKCKTASLTEMKAWHGFDEHRGKICQEAAKHGNLVLVQGCLEDGLPPGMVMRCAAMNGSWSVLDHLISQGWDINKLEPDGRTIRDWTDYNPERSAEVEKRGGLRSKDLPA